MLLMQHSSYWFMATDHRELAKGRTGADSFARVDDHFLTPFLWGTAIQNVRI